MESLTFVGTFLATGFGVVALWQRLQGRRRAQAILRGRDPAGQRATVVRGLSLTERWELAARQAGLDWTARTYLMIICAGVGLGALFLMAGSLPIACGLFGIACMGPWLLVRVQQRSRSEKFAQQLPGALILAANTIRAGGTMLQAVRAIARQMPDPIAAEFARVERALQLQVPLGTALEGAQQRIGAPAFTAVVVACKVAGQAGADLDAVLENIANDVVEDRQFRDAMRAASSEGRMSARVVTAVPFVVGGYFYFTNPAYFDPMLHSPLGRILLPLSFGAILIGWFIISRITDVRNW